jgi:hypothetical protein
MRAPGTAPTLPRTLGPLSLGDVLQAAATWTSDLADPALARPAPGARLAAAVRDATRQAPVHQPGRVRGGGRVLLEHVDMLEEQLTALRRMDDRTGGGPFSQRQARIALRESVTLLNAGRYDAAGDPPCRTAGDDGTVANAMGMLAHQHAAIGDPGAALQFADAAVEHRPPAGSTAPPSTCQASSPSAAAPFSRPPVRKQGLSSAQPGGRMHWTPPMLH